MTHCKHAQTLTELFQDRVKLSSTNSAYRYYDELHEQWVSIGWQAMAQRVDKCVEALKRDGYKRGARIGIMLPNGIDWVMVEQATMRCGLIPVPLYFNDRAENVRYILKDAGLRCLFMHHSLSQAMTEISEAMAALQTLVILGGASTKDHSNSQTYLAWVKGVKGVSEIEKIKNVSPAPEDIASIVYTSGTTGPPKGVMLSHKNILWNARVSLNASLADEQDRFLSLLPLSHMLERTAGYYIPMIVGAEVAFARSPQTYADDLRETQPTILVVVPRVLERIQEKIEQGLRKASFVKRWLFSHCIKEGWQGFLEKADKRTYGFLSKIIVRKFSQRLGGRVRLIICGGAPLNESVSRLFIGLGLDIIQGYGLTETSPVISVNRLDANRPDTVGLPLDDVEVRVLEQQELQTRSPGVMQGYWHNEEATRAVLDNEGWFKTGDQAVIEDGFIRIIGRLKDIVVLSTGEKISPTDVEMKLLEDKYIEQAMVIGNGCSTLTAMLVIDKAMLGKAHAAMLKDASEDAAEEFFLQRVKTYMKAFPGYVRIAHVCITDEPWTQENGCLTPTLKLKREVVEERFGSRLD